MSYLKFRLEIIISLILQYDGDARIARLLMHWIMQN